MAAKPAHQPLLLPLLAAALLASSCAGEEEDGGLCGNAALDPGEMCDGMMLGGRQCADFGYTGGMLACSAVCAFDKTGCTGPVTPPDPPPAACGNGTIDVGEDCDGAFLNGKQCTDLGFDAGTLVCSPLCVFDTAACTGGSAICGNAVLEAGEDCDGAELGTATCQTLGFTGGTLGCDALCAFDTTGCTGTGPVCGDGVMQMGEQCDTADFGAETCQTQGFVSGQLLCTADCRLDTSRCSDTEDCTAPPPVTDWLQDYLQEIVGKLSGKYEISPGVTLDQRWRNEERATARTYLKAEWEAWGLAAADQMYNSTDGNVYATLPLTHGVSDEWVMIGGHYDSVNGAPGADDNGTGTAIAVAAARYAASLPCRSRNLLFVAWDEEEDGFVGAYAFTDFMDQQGYNVFASYNVDMVGWDGDNDLTVYVSLASPGLFELLQGGVAATGLGNSLVEKQRRSSDHVAILAGGYPCAGIGQEVESDRTPYYHTSQDTWDKVDFGYTSSIAAMINAVLAEVTAVE
jgi:hypothetical protein